MDREEREELSRLNQWRQSIVEPSRLPLRSREEQRFDSYLPRNESQEKLKEAAEAFAAGEVQPPFLLIYGPPGLGKTHLAWAIAWEYVENWERAAYYQAEELLDDLRNSFGTGGAYEAKVKRLRLAPLLIIDDLGAQSDTEWGMAKLDMIVDYRYRMKADTVITTNTLELPPRILDRFREGLILAVKGDSYRKEKKHGEGD